MCRAPLRQLATGQTIRYHHPLSGSDGLVARFGLDVADSILYK